jgi:REP element-mobilizing transposase RayT
MKYRRIRVGGGTYFFTVVTHDRRPFLVEVHGASAEEKAEFDQNVWQKLIQSENQEYFGLAPSMKKQQ